MATGERSVPDSVIATDMAFVSDQMESVHVSATQFVGIGNRLSLPPAHDVKKSSLELNVTSPMLAFQSKGTSFLPIVSLNQIRREAFTLLMTCTTGCLWVVCRSTLCTPLTPVTPCRQILRNHHYKPTSVQTKL
eukprot:PhF_6_TR15944/c0_g1_i1/m.24789